MNQTELLDVFTSNNCGFASLLIDGSRIQKANEGARRLWGEERTELGAEVASLFDARSHQKLADALSSREAGSWELQASLPQAPPTPVQLLSVPLDAQHHLLLSEGARAPVFPYEQVLRANAELGDLTRQLSLERAELRRTRDALQASQQRYHLLVDAIPQIVWMTRPDGAAEFLNQRWFDYTGLAPTADPYGWMQAIHPEDRERVLTVRRRAAETSVPFEVEYRLRRADGACRWHLDRGLPFFDALGQRTMWFGTCTDIEERKRVETLQQQIIGIVCHDLRTPLTAMLMSIHSVLRSHALGDSERTMIARIERSAVRMQHLVNDLVDFTRGQTGRRIPIRLQPADLTQVCQAVVEEMRAAYPERRIHWTPPDPVAGEWDPDRLAQVLTNLLMNAMRHGTRLKPVELRLQATSGECVLDVHNEGAPIDQQLLPHLFEPFRQGSPGATEGLGLGLYIAHRIIDAHGGTIAVESTAAAGTTFRIRLPRRRRV